ncbi:MAG TPA: shikimate dehydrogenase [Gemmataceae bacterium]|nr:shikimate dehydrogenase [Gemmataceae bacterium]
MICAVIGRTRHKMIQVEIQEAAKRGAELVEVRLDYLAKAPDFDRLLENRPCPLIATLRRASDGGRWTAPDEGRRMLLRQAIVAGFDWVDLETDIAGEVRRYKSTRRIISYHNMHEVPADLEKIHETMCGQDADVVKIAVMAQKQSDNLRVLNLIRRSPKPTVAICMGDLGTPTRVLAGRFGAPFTYAAFNKERCFAPGMLTFDELSKVYNYGRIKSDTQVYGVVGDPIGHSLSPLLHNTAFRKLDINAVYVPFRVPRGELEAFLKGYDTIPVSGYSVTIPHKSAALAMAAHKDQAAQTVQAANTLIRSADGFQAYNTDYEAARESVLQNFPTLAGEFGNLGGRTVLLLGAGGAARAIAHAMHDSGALVTIASRNPEKAQRLAEEVGCRHLGWEERNRALCDLLINCTPVGMHPNVDEMPIHVSALRQDLAVFDTVYNPENTLLIKEARERGAHVLTGVDMFIRQAAMQLQLFTNQQPPLELLAKVVRRALSPVNYRDEE